MTSLVLEVNGLSIRMAHSLTEDAHLRAGEAGVSLLTETPVVPAPYSGETDGGLSATASRQRSWRTSWANRLAGRG